jgi:hypothetical protein
MPVTQAIAETQTTSKSTALVPDAHTSAANCHEMAAQKHYEAAKCHADGHHERAGHRRKPTI